MPFNLDWAEPVVASRKAISGTSVNHAFGRQDVRARSRARAWTLAPVPVGTSMDARARFRGLRPGDNTVLYMFLRDWILHGGAPECRRGPFAALPAQVHRV